MCLKNTFENSYNNKKIVNKKLHLRFENSIVNNIFLAR